MPRKGLKGLHKLYGLYQAGACHIEGSVEATHGFVCSGVRKLQSMNVLKLPSTKTTEVD